jgi:hypothetical protein
MHWNFKLASNLDMLSKLWYILSLQNLQAHIIQHSSKFWSLQIFESLKKLFNFIWTPNNLWKHWSNSFGWNMAKCMYKVVLQSTCKVVEKPNWLLWIVMKSQLLIVKLDECACVCGGRVEMNPPPTNYATIYGWWLCI